MLFCLPTPGASIGGLTAAAVTALALRVVGCSGAARPGGWKIPYRPGGKVIVSGATSGVPISSWIWACGLRGMSRGLPV
jgi:hypothetical protein